MQMNVVSSSGDVLHHHHHPLAVSVGGTEDEEGEVEGGDNTEEGRTRRRPARGQSRIEFERLAAFFHVPINEAAKGLGVCATVLKKVCRKHGIPRWPHRKIKKLDTMLAMLETAANKPGNPQHDDDVRKKMEAVMRDRAVLMTEGKLVGEGKSDSRRSKAEGKGRDRKRKKPDDEEEEENEVEHETTQRQINNYALAHSNSEQDLLQASGQMLMGNPMNHMGHLTSMEMNGVVGYHMGMSAYPPGYASYAAANGIAIPGNYSSYNSLFWNGAQLNMPNNISLPGVHSISSGVISSTTGMMMHNLPPPLTHSTTTTNHHLSMAPPPPSSSSSATPISPLTPSLPLSLSSSNPLPIPLSHSLAANNKHAKLSHSDVLLDMHHPHYTPSSSSSSSPSPSSSAHYAYHQRSSNPHLAYSDFSVQHETPNDSSSSPSSSHFRLFGHVDVSLHPPTTASE